MKPQGFSLFTQQKEIDKHYAAFECPAKKGCQVAADCVKNNFACRDAVKVLCFFICIFLSNITFAQQGSKGVYSEKKPVTEETLTKNAQIFDTFVESGKHVYYQKKVKKDGSVEDYYFIVVEAKDKKGNSVLRKKKIYIYETNQN